MDNSDTLDVSSFIVNESLSKIIHWTSSVSMMHCVYLVIQNGGIWQ